MLNLYKKIKALELEKVRRGFYADVEDSLRNCPLEDYFSNPLEELLKDYIDFYPNSAQGWIENLILGEEHSAFASSILICLGRLSVEYTKGWGYDIAKKALESDELMMRDAGVQALEGWGDTDAYSLLSGHNERVFWLAEHIYNILNKKVL